MEKEEEEIEIALLEEEEDDDALGKTLITDPLPSEMEASLITQVLEADQSEVFSFGNSILSEVDEIYAANALMDQLTMTKEEVKQESTLFGVFVDEFIEEENTRTKTKEEIEADELSESLVYELLEEERKEEEEKRKKPHTFTSPPRYTYTLVSNNNNRPEPKKPKDFYPLLERELEKISNETQRSSLRKILHQCLETGLKMEIWKLEIEKREENFFILSLSLKPFSWLSPGGENFIRRKFKKEETIQIEFKKVVERNNPNIFIDISVILPSQTTIVEKEEK